MKNTKNNNNKSKFQSEINQSEIELEEYLNFATMKEDHRTEKREKAIGRRR